MYLYRDYHDKSGLEAWNQRISKPYETIKLTTISPTVGAEVEGVDLTKEIPSNQLDEIFRAATEKLVLVFRDQKLTVEDQKRFARHFGRLHKHVLAKSTLIAGASQDPELLAWKTGKDSRYTAGDGWHHDVSCDPEPIRASFLYVEKTPEIGGGDTLYANGYLAYETLSPAIRRLIDELTAVHDGSKAWTAGYGAKPAAGAEFPAAEHPIAPIHPATGRRFLYVNPTFTTHIPQLSRYESDALLDLLFRHVERSVAFQASVHWTPHTLTYWDNWAVQHHAVWDYYPYERWGQRVSAYDGAPKAE